MSHYTDRLIFEGIYKQQKFVCEHDDGCGIVTISSEQIENIIAMIKKFSICKNTGKEDAFWQIAKFCDLYCIGTIMNDQIDFTKIEKQLKKQKILIYDPIKTPRLYAYLETIMPPIMLRMVQEIQEMEVGDQLPDIIQRIYDHGDIPSDEMVQAELNAFGQWSGFVNDPFYVDNQD